MKFRTADLNFTRTLSILMLFFFDINCTLVSESMLFFLRKKKSDIILDLINFISQTQQGRRQYILFTYMVKLCCVQYAQGESSYQCAKLLSARCALGDVTWLSSLLSDFSLWNFHLLTCNLCVKVHLDGPFSVKPDREKDCCLQYRKKYMGMELGCFKSLHVLEWGIW